MYSWKLPSVNSSLNGCIFINWSSDVLCVFKMKTWRVQYDFENVFFSIPNLARCKTFKSKYDAFWIFQFKVWHVRKNDFKIWLVLKFFSPKSEFFLVFQVLIERRFFLSTLKTNYFEEENYPTRSVVVLVARCTTGSCQNSIRLSMVVKF